MSRTRSIRPVARAGAALAAGAAAVISAAVLGAAPAAAESGADAIVTACGSQPVCLYDGASISNASQLRSSLPQGVQVVVIPQPDQAQSVSSNSIAAAVKEAGGARTVIVIEDQPAKDRFAVSSDDDAASISKALYGQNQADGGVAVAAIRADLVAPAETGGLPFGGILAAVITGVVVLAGGGVGIAAARRRRAVRGARSAAQDKQLRKDLDDALDGPDGRFVREAVERLRDLAGAYPRIGPQISALAGHVTDLFVRVERRGTDQQMRLLTSQYKDTLSKLLKGLDPDYYGDILANPQYWSGPEARVQEVHRAVEAVDHQVIDNIRQVNESRDLEFQVALGSLVRAVNEAKLSDVYHDENE